MGYVRDDPQVLARRLSAFVSSRASAKELAASIESDVRTAENIRQGHWPQARHWRGIVRAFGRDVIEAVFNPEIDAVEARLEEEERCAREAYLAAKARREAARLATARDPDLFDSAGDRRERRGS